MQPGRPPRWCWCWTACGGSSSAGVSGVPAQLTVSSPDLSGQFAKQNTCDGASTRPAVLWSGAPAGTAGFAIEMTDPNAPGGSFTHWLVYNLPASATALSGGVAGAAEGKNDFGRIGYGGPCPPLGDPPHQYTIAVYALDAALNLPPGIDRTKLENAMQPHVVATGTLEATYQRQ